MTLEATIVILDNTEYARNGDHLPTRYEAQTDTIQAIISSKQQMNNENAIGVMTMGGPQIEMLTTPTNDPEAILGCLFGVKLRGDQAHFMKSLQIAQLALKHRKNKHMRQRVIVFVASPVRKQFYNAATPFFHEVQSRYCYLIDQIVEDDKDLEKVAKQLKKNNLSVDVVNLCQTGDNVAKLSKFVETVNSGNSSHFLNAESGITNLNESLFNSPILNSFADSHPAASTAPAAASHSTGAATSMANPFAEYGGIDPSEDPELAQVMKLSLEEEKRRLEQESAATATQATTTTQATVAQTSNAVAETTLPNNTSVVQNTQIDNTMADENQGLLEDQEFDDMDEEELMRQALLESQQENPFDQNNEATEEQKLLPTEADKNLQTQADLMQDEDFVEDLLKLVQKDQDKKDEEKK